MAVACIVSIGEHFCLLFSTFSVFFFFFPLRVKNILGHFNRRFVPQISQITQTGSYLANESSIWKWESTRSISFADISTWAQKLDPDLSERSIRTIKDKNMEQNSLFVEIVGFMRFV